MTDRPDGDKIERAVALLRRQFHGDVADMVEEDYLNDS